MKTPAEFRDEHLAYMLSLLISNDAAPQDAAGLFQICGTIAAAGFVGGDAVSFGAPRPDHVPFYGKLGEAGTRLGEGIAQTGWTEGASPRPQDAGVDVVAWRSCPDGLPGQLYLLGQCASGRKWREKSPRRDYDSFHRLYWNKPPASPLIAATFIPFDLRAETKQSNYQTLSEAYRWRRWTEAPNSGIVIDRFRLAHYFALGVGSGERARVERIERISDVRDAVARGLAKAAHD